MIRQSFIFLDNVRKRKEKRIWEQGIGGWNEFLGRHVKGISSLQKEKHDRLIRLARINLDYENASFFNDVLPKGEMWRIYPEFRGNAAFLDIETSGWDITVVGIFDGYSVKHFVKGFNLTRENVLREIYRHKVLLTFNGRSFDIPILNRYFRDDIKVAHIELRHVCSKIGLNGGLKSIERQLGIKRAEEVQSMLGNEAVYCWEMWRHTRQRKYLDLLVQYNAEDVLNLLPLAEHSVKELWKRTKSQSQAL